MKTPKQIKTSKELQKLPRDNWSWKGFWMLLDGPKHISIAEQVKGSPAKGIVTIPKKVFESMISVYETGKK